MTGPIETWERRQLDRVLVRCGTGNQDALGELYDRTVGHSLALAWCLARERVAAERIVLESYVEVWRTAARFDPSSGSAMAWVLAAVRRHGLSAAA